MAGTPSQEQALVKLNSVCIVGKRLLAAVYAYRSISRAVPPLHSVDSPLAFARAVCCLFDTEFPKIAEVYEYHGTLLESIRGVVDVLARSRGDPLLRETSIQFSLVKGLALVHELDVLKQEKSSLTLDCDFYEKALLRVLGSGDVSEQETLRDIQKRLRNCRAVKTFVANPWSIMNELFTALSDVPRSSTVLFKLSGFVCRCLGSNSEKPTPHMLPHQRYALLLALPVTLYLNNFLNKHSPQEESIPQHRLETCIKYLRKYPIVPSIGDFGIIVSKPIKNIELGKDGKKHGLAGSLQEMEKRLLDRLDVQYSLKFSMREIREVHNGLCEGLMVFRREVDKFKHEQAAKPLQICEAAFEIGLRALEHLSAWHNKVFELHIWKKMVSLSSLSRCRSLTDKDLSNILEVLVYSKGLVRLLVESADELVTWVKEKTVRRVRYFLSTGVKRIAESGNVEIQDLVGQLQSVTLCYNGKCVNEGDGCSAGLRLDVTDVHDLGKIKGLVERIVCASQTKVPKGRFGQMRGKRLAALKGGWVKDCRDFLRDVYGLEHVLKLHKTLQEVTDYSGLYFREMDIEKQGTSYVHGTESVCAQACKAFLDAPYGGCVDSVLFGLGLYENAANAALSTFSLQHLYVEVWEEGLRTLDNVLDTLASDILTYYNRNACRTVLGPDCHACCVKSKDQIDDVTGERYDLLFETKSFRMAGCWVDLECVLVEKIEMLIIEKLDRALKRIARSDDPCSILDAWETVRISRHSHALLSQHLNLGCWSELWVTVGGTSTDTGLFECLSTCITKGLLSGFEFDTFLNVFRRKSRDQASGQDFGLGHIQALTSLLGGDRVEAFAWHIVEWVTQLLDDTMVDHLRRILFLCPDEMVRARRNPASPADHHLDVLNMLKNVINEREAWTSALSRLEQVGNCMAFLLMLDAVVESKVTVFCKYLGQALSIVRQSGELPLAKVKGEDPEFLGGFGASMVSAVRDLVAGWDITPGGQEGHSLDWYGSLHYVVSTLLFTSAHSMGLGGIDGMVFGDGVVWACRLLISLSGQDAVWESTDWTLSLHKLCKLERIGQDDAFPDELEKFTIWAGRYMDTWQHVSLLATVPNANPGPLAVQKDPTFVGFFGGVGVLGLGNAHRGSPTALRGPLSMSVASFRSKRGRTSPRHNQESHHAEGKGNSTQRVASAEPGLGRQSMKSPFANPRFAVPFRTGSPVSGDLNDYGTLRVLSRRGRLSP